MYLSDTIDIMIGPVPSLPDGWAYFPISPPVQPSTEQLAQQGSLTLGSMGPCGGSMVRAAHP